MAVRGDETAHRHDAEPEAPAYGGADRRALPRYRTDSVALHELAIEGGRRAFRQVTWRQGSRGAMRSRFRVPQVRPAGKIPRTLAATDAGGGASLGGRPCRSPGCGLRRPGSGSRTPDPRGGRRTVRWRERLPRTRHRSPADRATGSRAVWRASGPGTSP
ncbi:transposase [Streptomyces sp. NPDC006692]|uniref:transposase n=1 Tax=unclassified Streptomyces TaxID=2593676 RepID=UPI0036A649E8